MLFIAGSLASQFLNDIDGKAFGEIYSGPYKILRDLGITKKNVSIHSKELNERSFLLMIRGYEYELDMLEALITNSE